MSTNMAVPLDHVPAAGIPLSERGPAPVNVVVTFGFWLFLLSDIVIFSALFAAYAVLSGQSDGGPTGSDLFNKRHVLVETACLLASSFSCGMTLRSFDRQSLFTTYFWALATWLLRWSVPMGCMSR